MFGRLLPFLLPDKPETGLEGALSLAQDLTGLLDSESPRVFANGW